MCGDTGCHLHALSPLPSPIHPTTGLSRVVSALSWNPSESQRIMLNCTIKTYSQVQSATLGFVYALLTSFRPLPRVTYSQVRGPLCLRRSPTRICSARSARTSCGRRAAPATAGTCSATRASSSTLTPMGEPARSAEKRESLVPAQLPVIRPALGSPSLLCPLPLYFAELLNPAWPAVRRCETSRTVPQHYPRSKISELKVHCRCECALPYPSLPCKAAQPYQRK